LAQFGCRRLPERLLKRLLQLDATCAYFRLSGANNAEYAGLCVLDYFDF
jgi:hypothetical protein